MASRCSQVSVIRLEIEVERNPPRSLRRKRTKKIAVAVRHLWPNLGADGAIRLAVLRAFSPLPTGITFSSTFPGIHRYIWRVDWFPIEPKGSLGKTLAITMVGLPTCIGCKWVFQLQGIHKLRVRSGVSCGWRIPRRFHLGFREMPLPSTANIGRCIRKTSARRKHSDRRCFHTP